MNVTKNTPPKQRNHVREALLRLVDATLAYEACDLTDIDLAARLRREWLDALEHAKGVVRR